MDTPTVRRRPRWANTVIVTALVAAAALGLSGAGSLRQASAAPVPAAQANCPPPVDPKPVAASTTAFAQIAGIPGDAPAKQVRNWVTLSSVRVGVFGPGTGLCGATGTRTTFEPVVLEKAVDRASVPLLAAAVQNKHLSTVRIDIYNSAMTMQPVTYIFSDVVVTSVRQLQRSSSLTEEVSLSFARVTYQFTPTNPDGSPGAMIVFSWDVVRNAPA